MINATVAGNVGKDAEIKASKNGKDYVTFSVAVNSGKGDEKQVTWIGVRTMQVSIAEFIRKGDPITVAGDLTLDTGKDGKSYLNLFASKVTLQGGKRDAKVESQVKGLTASAMADASGEIPF